MAQPITEYPMPSIGPHQVRFQQGRFSVWINTGPQFVHVSLDCGQWQFRAQYPNGIDADHHVAFVKERWADYIAALPKSAIKKIVRAATNYAKEMDQDKMGADDRLRHAHYMRDIAIQNAVRATQTNREIEAYFK